MVVRRYETNIPKVARGGLLRAKRSLDRPARGCWFFRVDRELPARQLSFAEAAPRIRIAIPSHREQLALDRLNAFLTSRYRRHTVCHRGYSAPECRNG